MRAAFSDATLRLGEQGAQRVHVHLDLREVERDLLRVRFDERVHFAGHRAAQRRQRLAQARARELRIGVFPEQRGEALAALRRAVLQREEGEQGAGLAGRDPERPVTRAPELEATEQSQAQHGPQAYVTIEGDVHLYASLQSERPPWQNAITKTTELRATRFSRHFHAAVTGPSRATPYKGNRGSTHGRGLRHETERFTRPAGLDLERSPRSSTTSWPRNETLGYFGNPLATLDEALAEDADFAAAHALRADLAVMSSEQGALPLIRESLAAFERIGDHATAREQAHVAAAHAWLEGRFERAAQLYGAIAIEHPRDLIALQAGHLIDFYLGDSIMLRDRIAQALPYWNHEVPGYGYLLGMHAFGLEETGNYGRAEDVGRHALGARTRATPGRCTPCSTCSRCRAASTTASSG